MESLCCIPEANIMLWVNYISIEKTLTISSICKDVEQLELSYIAGGNKNCFKHYGKLFDTIFNNN